MMKNIFEIFKLPTVSDLSSFFIIPRKIFNPILWQEILLRKNLDKFPFEKNLVKNLVLLPISETIILKKIKKIEKSSLIGEILAKRAKDKKIEKVYFDRGEYKYHGRVKTFAETLRKHGLKF